MKTLLLSSLLACGLMLTATAQAQEATAPAEVAQTPATEEEIAYGLFCTPDAELTLEQVELLSKDEQSVAARQGFQGFVNDPKGALGSILTAFKDLEEKAKAILADPQNAEQLNQIIAQYAAENKVSVEEATKAVTEFQINAIIEQNAGGSAVNSVAGAVLQSCGVMSYLQAQLDKSGCKNSETGAAVDLTVATKLCSDVAPKIVEMGGYQQEVAKIQKDLQDYMAALQQAAQAKAQPSLEAMDKTATSIYDLVVGFVGEQKPVEVPLVAPQP